MTANRKLVISDEAVQAKGQHQRPCADCPWARKSLNGWLGALTPEEWVREAHGEARIECHTKKGAQCAGAAIYRANICKSPRDRTLLRLESDTVRVFASPGEFLEHHHAPPNVKKTRSGVNDDERTVPCATCGMPTTKIGTKRCDWCWEVESRLEGYLQRGGLKARRALTEALEGFMP